MGSHHSALIKEVVTGNAAERESLSVFIAFNLLSRIPATLRREAEITVQSETTHTPRANNKPASLAREVQKEVIGESVATK